MRFKILQSLFDIHNTTAEKRSFCSEFELSNKQMHVQKTVTMFFSKLIQKLLNENHFATTDYELQPVLIT